MVSSDTIFALSSASGRAGVAVVRISGDEAFSLAERLSGYPLEGDRKVRLRMLRDPADGRHLDTGLVVGFSAPGSFTGEDVAELHIHGGRAVIESVLAALGHDGAARAAEPGEFTRRAFHNGRLDLTEVEGLADLIDAETEAQRIQALRQYGGALGELYENWRRRLMTVLAHIEAAIDFVDEADVPAAAAAAVLPEIEGLEKEMTAHLDDARRGERLREGVHIAIVGPPNAGKSSVLNQLARREAAIVSARAGTTRDVVEVHLDLGGVPVIVADTAGLHAAGEADPVEAEGMRRARSRAAAADICLVVLDGTASGAAFIEAIPAAPGQDLIYLVNKADLPGWHMPAVPDADRTFSVSARTGAGFGGVLTHLHQNVAEVIGDRARPVLTRTRHREAVRGALEGVRAYRNAKMPELGAEELRRAVEALGRVTGRVDVEDLLDVIFRDFCIGK